MAVIYALRCPLANAIRYIGKADDAERRLYCHLFGEQKNEYQSHKARWIRKLLRQGLKPELRVIYPVPVGVRWQDAERFFIASALAMGLPLTNSTAGGEGLRLITEDDRVRHAEAVRLSLSGSEIRARISAGVRAYAASNPEWIEKRRGFMRERMTNPVSRAQVIAALNAPEVIAANSARGKLRMSDPATRAKWSADAKEQWQDTELLRERSRLSKLQMVDPANRERSRRAAKTQNADPEYIKRRQEYWSRPENRKAAADAARAAWARRKAQT